MKAKRKLKTIEEQIEELLQKGLKKSQIKEQLKDNDPDGEVEFYLKNIPYPADKNRYLFFNISLFVILLYITLKKLYFALSFGQFNLFMLLAMVVPTVNIYILREIMRFRRIGYLFCLVLSTLSLVNAENRAFPEIVLIPIMIFLSGFLFFKLFYQYEREEGGSNENS